MKIVDLVFNIFSSSIGELPIVHRAEIFNIIKIKKFKLFDRVVTPVEQTNEIPDIFLILSGNAVVI